MEIRLTSPKKIRLNDINLSRTKYQVEVLYINQEEMKVFKFILLITCKLEVSKFVLLKVSNFEFIYY